MARHHRASQNKPAKQTKTASSGQVTSKTLNPKRNTRKLRHHRAARSKPNKQTNHSNENQTKTANNGQTIPKTTNSNQATPKTLKPKLNIRKRKKQFRAEYAKEGRKFKALRKYKAASRSLWISANRALSKNTGEDSALAMASLAVGAKIALNAPRNIKRTYKFTKKAGKISYKLGKKTYKTSKKALKATAKLPKTIKEAPKKIYKTAKAIPQAPKRIVDGLKKTTYKASKKALKLSLATYKAAVKLPAKIAKAPKKIYKTIKAVPKSPKKILAALKAKRTKVRYTTVRKNQKKAYKIQKSEYKKAFGKPLLSIRRAGVGYTAMISKAGQNAGDDGLVFEAHAKAIRTTTNIRDGIIVSKHSAKTAAKVATAPVTASVKVGKAIYYKAKGKPNPARSRRYSKEYSKQSSRHLSRRRQMKKRAMDSRRQRVTKRPSILAKVPIIGGFLDKGAMAFGKIFKVMRRTMMLMGMAFFLLIIIIIFAPFLFIMGLFTQGTALGSSFLADDNHMNQASIYYTELEVELKQEILNININGLHAVNGEIMYAYILYEDGWNSYLRRVWVHYLPAAALVHRLIIAPPLINQINHDPLSLMAYLTALFEDFTYPTIRGAISSLFNSQYNLQIQIQSEERERTYMITVGEEQDLGSYDYYGNWISYLVWVEWQEEMTFEYTLYTKTITLQAIPMEAIFFATANDDQVEHYEILMESRGNRQWVHSPFPLDWLPFVSSHFGWRIHPITGIATMHNGIDIALPTGTPIHAAHSGIVTVAQDSPSAGLWVEITETRQLDNRTYTIQTRYLHMSHFSVALNQEVEQGDIIGAVGATGAVTGPHLHMDLILNGTPMNPVFFVLTEGD